MLPRNGQDSEARLHGKVVVGGGLTAAPVWGRKDNGG